MATFGQLTEFRVAFGGSRGTVTLIYGDKRRKRTRGKKPSAPGAAKGEPKPAAKLPAAVPSFVPPPAQPGASREVQGGPKLVAKPLVAGPSGNRSPPSSPTRTTRTGPRQVFPTHASTPRSSTSGSTLLPTAPVEPPVSQTLIFFGKAFKIYYYFFFFINSLTLILLTARQNCSQITSNLDLSKQILFWVVLFFLIVHSCFSTVFKISIAL